MPLKKGQVSGSFRDPSGVLFFAGGKIFRKIYQVYRGHYDRLIASGLYHALLDQSLIIPHEEIEIEEAGGEDVYRVIQPEIVDFISYPYEWSFSELKDAALATLQIQKTAFQYGMTLKDSSAYNIQFLDGKPVLIDTLSFEIYQEGQYWTPYRQFCQHFLAPLALMSFTDVRLNQLLRIYIDGCPLDLASRLLPFKTRLRGSLLTHVHLHARSQKIFSEGETVTRKRGLSKIGLQGLIDSLEGAVSKLQWKPEGTDWSNYYQDHNYTAEALESKKAIVSSFIEQVNPNSCWDLGGNTGLFSRIASDREIPTISFDLDPGAVELNYLQVKKVGEKNLLPLVMDLTNPSAGTGWANQERESLQERGPADLILALALIHHLAIGNNLPFERIAAYFSDLCRWLVVEFVPKSDSQVQRMLSTRVDIFSSYSKETFEKEFSRYFRITRCEKVQGSERVIYLLEK